MEKRIMIDKETNEEVLFNPVTRELTQEVEVTVIKEVPWEPGTKSVILTEEKEKLINDVHSSFAKIDVTSYLSNFRHLQEERKPDGSYECLNAMYGIPKAVGQHQICTALGYKPRHWIGNGPDKVKYPEYRDRLAIYTEFKNGKSASQISDKWNYPKDVVYRVINSLKKIEEYNTEVYAKASRG